MAGTITAWITQDARMPKEGLMVDDIVILTGQAMAVYLATAAFAVWCVVGLGER